MRRIIFAIDHSIPCPPSCRFALQRLSAIHPLIPMDKICEVYLQALSYNEGIPRMSVWGPEKTQGCLQPEPNSSAIHFPSPPEQLKVSHSD